jgi:soluble P-type ATPase
MRIFVLVGKVSSCHDVHNLGICQGTEERIAKLLGLHIVYVYKTSSQYTKLDVRQILGVALKIDTHKGNEITEFVALKRSDLGQAEGVLHKLREFGIGLETF